ncbi:hypothetical protein FS749_008868 [Ceratobasidium sp. UAMH 11750]|nr:hypothetical protein FS749_008868 [Ceratobasidium sp. UAMH 11750]
MATKTLNFHTYGLQKETFLMLMFEPPNTSRLYRDQFPVVWKLVKLTPNLRGHGKATVRYVNRLAFGYTETEDNDLVDPSAWVDVQSGDVAVITGDTDSQYFGEVSHRTNNDHIICKNRSSARVDLSLGFVAGDKVNERFQPTFFWPDVGSGSNVTAEFTPILKAYVTGEYQESQYLRGEVDTDAIWSQDLDELDDVTGWNFVEDPETGVFTIEQAESV